MSAEQIESGAMDEAVHVVGASVGVPQLSGVAMSHGGQQIPSGGLMGWEEIQVSKATHLYEIQSGLGGTELSHALASGFSAAFDMRWMGWYPS